MSQWDDFIAALKGAVAQLAVGAGEGLANQLQSDAGDFVTEAKADLDLWTGQLASGAIDAEDFKDNVAGDADLAKMAALTAAGIAAADLQRLRAAVLNAVVTAAAKAFLPV